MREIKNKQLTNQLRSEGLEDIILCKDNGYFFIASNNEKTSMEICSLQSNSIYVNSFNQLTIDQWVEEIKLLFNH